ncbi:MULTISPECIES: oxidoreductase [Paenibacillus]|jgi:scyllo-inositol 2-dehydrogenase (NADP+)|uniref:oxidoreductase n=1 Tax=Paenibacillus TaxID=44249 RepID=UPI0003E294EF|nr:MULTISPECIES: oxidoreductase [Paenibacillus]ANA79906.1 oxidoreductase [Paenibacillus glucanolyticus]ETT38287.1 oxidoreductase domain-containing protein [Paenibacillus sp. FSL R5-808]
MAIQAGIIGYGLSGSVFHAPILRSVPDYKVHTVVSSDPDKVHKDLPDTAVVDSVDELLSVSEIDVVIITSPNTTHYEYSRLALEAGKHVVVEKPFTVTAAEADELIELAKQKGVLLTVYHNRRWDNDFLTVRNLLETGALGKLSIYQSQFSRYRPEVQSERWREQAAPGSGILYDLGSHLIDQALFLFGLPETLWADLRIERKGSKAHDYFHLVLGYATFRVILHSGSLVRQAGPKFELHGDKGSFLKYGMDPQEGQLKQGMRPGDAGWGEDSPDQYGELATELSGLAVQGEIETLPGRYQAFYQGLAEAVLKGGALPVQAEEARNVIRMIEYALQSHQEGRTIQIT